jgi:hypothetical protein
MFEADNEKSPFLAGEADFFGSQPSSKHTARSARSRIFKSQYLLYVFHFTFFAVNLVLLLTSTATEDVVAQHETDNTILEGMFCKYEYQRMI